MQAKGLDKFAGFALGFFLGPLGLLIAFVLPPDRNMQQRQEMQLGSVKKCPYCAELIRVEATKCRHCGSNLQRPMDAELAAQLRFSYAELNCYGKRQSAALESVIGGDTTAQAKAYASICKKIGRPHFEGPPRVFLVAYREQLKAHLS